MYVPVIVAVIAGVSTVLAPLLTAWIQTYVQRHNSSEHGETVKRIDSLASDIADVKMIAAETRVMVADVKVEVRDQGHRLLTLEAKEQTGHE